jgi:hypothetical protein
MINNQAMSCEHVLDLLPGSETVINFRFPKDQRTDITVGLAAVDPARGTAELVLDNLWLGYEMMQFVKSEDRWRAARPGPDGNVHAVIALGAPKYLNISSDDALFHSLQLARAAWNGKALRLTFRETGPVPNV